MVDQKDLVQALYSAIFSGMEGGNLPAESQPFVSLEWPGLPLDPRQYGNPWSPQNMDGSAEALEDFSALVDAIPSASHVYVPTGVGLESVYGLLVEATVGDGASPATGVAKAFTNARAKFASVIRGSTENAMAEYHPSYPSPLNWCDPSNAGLWTTATVNIGGSAGAGPTGKPATVLSGQVARVVQAQASMPVWRMATVQVASPPPRPAGGSVARTEPVVRPVMTKAAGGPRPRALTVLATQISQARAVNASVASPVRVNVAAAVPGPGRLGLSTAVPAAARVNVAGAVTARNPIVGIRPDQIARIQGSVPLIMVDRAAPAAVKEKPLTSSALQLSLKYLRVTIQRSWLDTMLFHLGGWSLDGVDPGAMSNGSTDNNPGFFPLLPTSFVVIKEVKISGSWSSDDKAFATQAVSGGRVAAFGPVTVASPAGGQGVFDGANLTVPGMQILAWISTPMPFLPPAPKKV